MSAGAMKAPRPEPNGAGLATAKAHLREAVFCSNTDRCKDTQNISMARITTLKQVALKALCSKNFTRHRSALRKPAEKLLGSATKTSHLSLKTPQFFCTAPLGFVRHCATGMRHPKMTPLSRVRVRACQTVSVFFLHLFTLVAQIVDT